MVHEIASSQPELKRKVPSIQHENIADGIRFYITNFPLRATEDIHALIHVLENIPDGKAREPSIRPDWGNIAHDFAVYLDHLYAHASYRTERERALAHARKIIQERIHFLRDCLQDERRFAAYIRRFSGVNYHESRVQPIIQALLDSYYPEPFDWERKNSRVLEHEEDSRFVHDAAMNEDMIWALQNGINLFSAFLETKEYRDYRFYHSQTEAGTTGPTERDQESIEQLHRAIRAYREKTFHFAKIIAQKDHARKLVQQRLLTFEQYAMVGDDNFNRLVTLLSHRVIERAVWNEPGFKELLTQQIEGCVKQFITQPACFEDLIVRLNGLTDSCVTKLVSQGAITSSEVVSLGLNNPHFLKAVAIATEGPVAGVLQTDQVTFQDIYAWQEDTYELVDAFNSPRFHNFFSKTGLPLRFFNNRKQLDQCVAAFDQFHDQIEDFVKQNIASRADFYQIVQQHASIEKLAAVIGFIRQNAMFTLIQSALQLQGSRFVTELGSAIHDETKMRRYLEKLENEREMIESIEKSSDEVRKYLLSSPSVLEQLISLVGRNTVLPQRQHVLYLLHYPEVRESLDAGALQARDLATVDGQGQDYLIAALSIPELRERFNRQESPFIRAHKPSDREGYQSSNRQMLINIVRRITESGALPLFLFGCVPPNPPFFSKYASVGSDLDRSEMEAELTLLKEQVLASSQFYLLEDLRHHMMDTELQSRSFFTYYFPSGIDELRTALRPLNTLSLESITEIMVDYTCAIIAQIFCSVRAILARNQVSPESTDTRPAAIRTFYTEAYNRITRLQAASEMRTYYEMGHYYIQNNRRNEAYEAFIRVGKADPRYIETRIQAALIAFEEAQYARAYHWFHEVLAAWEQFPALQQKQHAKESFRVILRACERFQLEPTLARAQLYGEDASDSSPPQGTLDFDIRMQPC